MLELLTALLVLALSGVGFGFYIGRPRDTQSSWHPLWIVIIPSGLVVVSLFAFVLYILVSFSNSEYGY